MAEIEKKMQAEANALLLKERFEFVLSFNGNIVCQRYFRIFGFKDIAFYSTDIVDTVRRIADIINNDLKAKTQTYLELTAPQVFEDESEMNEWVEKHGSEMRTPTFIALRKSEDTFIWNGEKIKPYQKPIGRSDYVSCGEEAPSYFTFTLYDNGWNLDAHKEVISYTWDASVFPKFVRFNIDLSNSKNPFKDEVTKVAFMPYEAALSDAMNDGHRDLIPQIVHEFYESCTSEKDSRGSFNTVIDCGKRSYSLNIRKKNFQYEDEYRRYFEEKTDDYFKKSRKN